MLAAAQPKPSSLTLVVTTASALPLVGGYCYNGIGATFSWCLLSSLCPVVICKNKQRPRRYLCCVHFGYYHNRIIIISATSEVVTVATLSALPLLFIQWLRLVVIQWLRPVVIFNKTVNKKNQRDQSYLRCYLSSGYVKRLFSGYVRCLFYKKGLSHKKRHRRYLRCYHFGYYYNRSILLYLCYKRNGIYFVILVVYGYPWWLSLTTIQTLFIEEAIIRYLVARVSLCCFEINKISLLL